MSGIFPFADNSTAIGRVESNWAVMIKIIINKGTLRNIPTTPHIIPQNTKFIKIANVDRFNAWPVNFGSNIFPNNISIPIKPIAVMAATSNDGPIANANNIGNAQANIDPIVGI